MLAQNPAIDHSSNDVGFGRAFNSELDRAVNACRQHRLHNFWITRCRADGCEYFCFSQNTLALSVPPASAGGFISKQKRNDRWDSARVGFEFRAECFAQELLFAAHSDCR